MILQIQRGLREDGFTVPMTKLCRWFDVPRRTVYYKPVKAKPKVQDRFAGPIKQMIEAEPSFGYRTVASLLRFNKNTVQRVFQLMGWQVRKRAVGHRPRIEALPSVARAPNERWATDLCRVWGGVMAGRPWRWSSTVTRANCSAGSSREAAGRRRDVGA